LPRQRYALTRLNVLQREKAMTSAATFHGYRASMLQKEMFMRAMFAMSLARAPQHGLPPPDATTPAHAAACRRSTKKSARGGRHMSYIFSS